MVAMMVQVQMCNANVGEVMCGRERQMDFSKHSLLLRDPGREREIEKRSRRLDLVREREILRHIPLLGDRDLVSDLDFSIRILLVDREKRSDLAR